jgi:soluble lytic murein transglycosylase
MNTFDAKTWRKARRALERAVMLHLDDPNVSHIDLGFRMRSSEGHRLTPELAVRVHVRRKLYGEAFEKFAARHPHWVVDAQRIGFTTDVPEARYELARPDADEEVEHPSQFHKHVQKHNSAAALFGEMIGGRVRDRRSDAEMILSTWHDMTNLGTEYVRDAMPADLDAAIARISRQRLLHNERHERDAVQGPIIPQLGMRVMKLGGKAATGIISGVLGCGLYRYGDRHRLIRHVVHIAPQEQGLEIGSLKDSGVWWTTLGADERRRAAGVHFAGSTNPQFALALSMPEVLETLKVEITSARQDGSATCRDAEQLAETQGADPTARIAPQPSHRTAAQALLLATLFFATLGFCNFRMAAQQQQQKQIERADLAVQCLLAAAKVDSARQQSIRKIVSIIARYNPAMAEPMKFKIAEEVYRMSLKYSNLDVELICATITHESGRSWNPLAVSRVGALGLMQIMPLTGRDLAIDEGIAWTSAEETLFDPVLNIRLGCRYLSALVGAYNVDGGLAAYNGGERRAERWVRNGRVDGILHEETAFYVPSILKIYEQYRRMSI